MLDFGVAKVMARSRRARRRAPDAGDHGDGGRHDRRHAGLHGAGTAPRRGARRADRRLQPGRDRLRDAVAGNCRSAAASLADVVLAQARGVQPMPAGTADDPARALRSRASRRALATARRRDGRPSGGASAFASDRRLVEAASADRLVASGFSGPRVAAARRAACRSRRAASSICCLRTGWVVASACRSRFGFASRSDSISRSFSGSSFGALPLRRRRSASRSSIRS